MFYCILFVSAATVIGGAIALAHGTQRVNRATAAATKETQEVHAATSIFLDWLKADAIDRQLDAMTLRRLHLLDAAAARRIQGLGLLALLVGVVGFLLAYAANTLQRGILRLPDTTMDQSALTVQRRKNRTIMPPRQARRAKFSNMAIQQARQPS